MQIDKDLLQYCKDKEFPLGEMGAKDFKAAENMSDLCQFIFISCQFVFRG